LRDSDIFKEMGSEIERAFAAYFVVMLRAGGVEHELARTPHEGCGFFLLPQYEIGAYRVDFLMGHSGREGNRGFDLRKCVVIECDGHDWHERTKEQAARDKKRDRFLLRNVGSVIHFTGSEIYRDVSACMGEAIAALGVTNGYAAK
jgi:very-short-patch-repair endonuclease